MIGRTIFALAALAVAATTEPVPIGDVAGVYELDGRALVVAPITLDGPPELMFLDMATGRARLLRQEGPDTYTAGPTLLAAAPVVHRLVFERDSEGSAVAVEWWEEESPPRPGDRAAIEVEESVFRGASGARLEGSWIRPPGPGPHPAVVLVHGSGDQDRWSFGPMPWILARHGIATLAWDKRAGGPDGDDPPLETLADDLLAALEHAQTRPRVDPDRVAVLGVSQGAWVASTAAGAEPDRIASLAFVSGTPLPVWRADLHARRIALESAGLAGEDLEAAMRLERRAIDYARTGGGYTRYVAARAAIVDESWFGLTRGDVRVSATAGRWAQTLRYDPAPDLARFRGPILLLVGGLDAYVPPEASVERMREIATESGNDDVTARLFERGLHHLLEAPGADPRGVEGVTRYVPGYWDALAGWLGARLDAGRPTDERSSGRPSHPSSREVP